MRMKPIIVELAIILTAVAGYVAKHPEPASNSAAEVQAAAAVPGGAGERVRTAMPESGADAGGAWLVPQAAVMHIGDSDYVIVKDGVHGYRRVAVQGHALGADRYAITGGLPQGLPIVTDSGLLFDQLAQAG
jgi:hypothetical protein